MDLDELYEKRLEVDLLEKSIEDSVKTIVHKNDFIKKRGAGVHLHPLKHQIDVFIFNCELNDINTSDVREFEEELGASSHKFVSDNGDLHIIFQFK